MHRAGHVEQLLHLGKSSMQFGTSDPAHQSPLLLDTQDDPFFIPGESLFSQALLFLVNMLKNREYSASQVLTIPSPILHNF